MYSKRNLYKLKIIALLTVYIFYAMYLFDPYVRADAFSDAVNEAQSIGRTMTESFKPGNIQGNSNPTNLIPQYDSAQAQKGTYTNFYANPAGMGGSINNDARTWVLDSEATRAHMDLSNDPVFGNKCLQRNESGKCIQWSLSSDVTQNSYPDCDTIVTTVYDDPEIEKTCTGTRTSYEKDCIMRAYPQLVQETINVPCDQYEIDPQPGQIYARCKDIFLWYKEKGPSGAAVDDCSCIYHGAWGCFNNPLYETDPPPPDAHFWATSYQIIMCNAAEGWDLGYYNSTNWYWRYDHSRIERLSVIEDSTCLDFDALLESGKCVVKMMIQCDPTEMFCFKSIDNFEFTNEVPVEDQAWKVQTTTGSTPCVWAGCTYRYIIIDGWNGMWMLQGCPTEETCISGICGGTVIVDPSPGYGQYTGTSRALNENVDWTCSTYTGNATYTEYAHYKNSFHCKTVAGEIDNYEVCLNYDDITVGDSLGGPYVVTAEPVRKSWDEPYEVRSPWGTRATVYTIKNSSLLGGSFVKSYRNVWSMAAHLVCNATTDTCQPLIDEGCYFDRTECIDEYCNERLYTYKCGGTGEVTAYEKSFVCAGEMRCMGTECKEVIRLESSSFGDAATASEILNNMRVDTAGGGLGNGVFPGQVYSCQDSPINCCDGNVPGISVADYVSAAKSLYTVGEAAVTTFAPEFASSMTYALGSLTSGWLGATACTIDLTASAGSAMVPATFTTLLTNATVTFVAEGVAALTGAAVEGIIPIVGAIIGAICTVLYVLIVLYAIYCILSFLWKYMFQCDEEDMETSQKLTLRVCHLVGVISEKVLGMPLKDRNVYCCFNSMLARLIQEQGRLQLGLGWGTGDLPDCRGFSMGEISEMDFTKMDLSEYMKYVKVKTKLTLEEEEAAMLKAMQSAEQLLLQ